MLEFGVGIAELDQLGNISYMPRLKLNIITQNVIIITEFLKNTFIIIIQIQNPSLQKTLYKLLKIPADSILVDHNPVITSQLLRNGPSKRQTLLTNIHRIMDTYL